MGGIDALMMDAVIRPRATDFCDWWGNILISEDSRIRLGGEGVRMRRYVLDLPGPTQRTLLITIFGRDDRLDEAIEAAAPILDSFESSAAAP